MKGDLSSFNFPNLQLSTLCLFSVLGFCPLLVKVFLSCFPFIISSLSDAEILSNYFNSVCNQNSHIHQYIFPPIIDVSVFLFLGTVYLFTAPPNTVIGSFNEDNMPLRRFTYCLTRAAALLSGKPGVNLIVVMLAVASWRYLCIIPGSQLS